MLNAFFRPELKLNDRWWHRLLLILFVCSFLYALYSVWNTPLPKFKDVGYLRDRMSANLQLLPDLINSGEKIGEYENNLHGDWYDKNEGWALAQPDVYCSKNITNHIEEISKKTKVASYKGNGPTELLALDAFKNYLNNQKADCVYLTSIDDSTKVIGWAWFIGDDMKVWNESTFASAVYILKGSLITTLPFLLIIILYYKVLLYIVFGNIKEKV